jgi:hypothetical protein
MTCIILAFAPIARCVIEEIVEVVWRANLEMSRNQSLVICTVRTFLLTLRGLDLENDDVPTIVVCWFDTMVMR